MGKRNWRRWAAGLLSFGIGLEDTCLLVLSAALCTLSMPPQSCSPLAFAAVAPLLVTLKAKPPVVAFRCGFVMGCIVSVANLSWFYGIFGPFALVLWSIMATFIGLFCAAFGLVQRWWGYRFALLVTPALWTAIDFFRSEQWPLKFGWLSLGYSQHDNPYLLGLAWIVGVYGVSAVIVLASALLVMAVQYRRQILTVALVLCAGLLTTGLVCLSRHRGGVENAGREVTFRVVQAERSFSTSLGLGRSAPLARDAVIVMPEYTIMGSPLQDPLLMRLVASFAREMQSYLVLGCIEYTRKVGDPMHFNNVALLVSPQGEVLGKYQKHHPIQFFHDGGPGRGFPTFKTPLGTLGVGICYDLDYEDVARRLVDNGAQVLIAPTMDARHWGKTQHIQHALMMPFRAAESGRFLVRSASSGVSMVVAPDGTIVRRLDVNEVGYFDHAVPLRRGKTVYVRYGFLFPWACQAGSLGLLLFGLIHRRRQASLAIRARAE